MMVAAAAAPTMHCTKNQPVLIDGGQVLTDTRTFCRGSTYRVVRTHRRKGRSCWGVFSSVDVVAAQRDGRSFQYPTLTAELESSGLTLFVSGERWNWRRPDSARVVEENGRTVLVHRWLKHGLFLPPDAGPVEVLHVHDTLEESRIILQTRSDRWLLRDLRVRSGRAHLRGVRALSEDARVTFDGNSVRIDGVLWDGASEPTRLQKSETGWQLWQLGTPYELDFDVRATAADAFVLLGAIRVPDRGVAPEDTCHALAEQRLEGQLIRVPQRVDGISPRARFL